jgi:ABC-type dipeptide/oligopeptide/nickel transport system ATPase component
MGQTEPLLAVDGLTIGVRKEREFVAIVDDVSLTVDRGETVCLLGESGSGKSMTCLAVLDILPPAARILSGSVRFKGAPIGGMNAAQKRAYRGGPVAMVFQDPVGALNPAHRIASQLRETFQLRGKSVSEAELVKLLARVGLYAPERVLDSYPHELSGGMNQRVMIAMALAGDPELLIADEPTTALDATIQAQILDLLGDLQQEFGLAILLVTHDIGVAADMAQRVAVMRQGRVVEAGPAEEVLVAPQHPYTRSLIEAARGLEAA